MDRYLNIINCKSYDNNTKRLKEFRVIKYTFNYNEINDQKFLDNIIDKGKRLALQVNPHAANDSKKRRNYERILINCTAGLIAEYLWIDLLKKYNIKTNKPTANFFLINFDGTKINSNKAFKKLANKRLILRKMIQYKIPNALRLTIGNKKDNELFIKSFRSLFK